jgi:Ca2+-binding RTX toxin-like protein
MLADKSAVGIAGLAREGDIDAIAYRFALKELNPFAIVGFDYAVHNQNGELDLLDPETGEGQLSEQWLTDRAKFLAEVLTYNTNDGETSTTRRIRYRDFASDITLLAANEERRITFGSDGEEGFGGGDGNDHLYGGGGDDDLGGAAGDDYLEGNAGDDTLSGGADDDTLIGGKGDDRLDGGDGYDTYLIDGSDTVEDSDGLGVLKDKAGKPLTGVLEKRPDGSYVFLGNDHITVNRDTDLILTLDDGSVITLKNWQDGQLGLRLVESGNTEVGGTITGDIVPTDLDAEKAGIQANADANGNPVGEAGPYADILGGTAGKDHVSAGELDDDVQGKDGDDWLEGQSGKDYLAETFNWTVTEASAETEFKSIFGETDPAGSAADVIYAGGGNDRVWAGAGNDVVYGEAGGDIVVGGAASECVIAYGYAVLISTIWFASLRKPQKTSLTKAVETKEGGISATRSG